MYVRVQHVDHFQSAIDVKVGWTDGAALANNTFHRSTSRGSVQADSHLIQREEKGYQAHRYRTWHRYIVTTTQPKKALRVKGRRIQEAHVAAKPEAQKSVWDAKLTAIPACTWASNPSGEGIQFWHELKRQNPHRDLFSYSSSQAHVLAIPCSPWCWDPLYPVLVKWSIGELFVTYTYLTHLDAPLLRSNPTLLCSIWPTKIY